MSDREQDEKGEEVEKTTELAEATTELDGAGSTERRPPVEATAPRPAAPERADEPRLSDVGGALAGYLRGRAALLADLVRRHRGTTVALALIACATAVLLGIALSRALSVPDEATVADGARTVLSTPEYSSGTYGTDTALVSQDIDVRGVTRSQTAPDGTDAQFGASGYATAEVVVTYSGQSVSASQGATLSFALVDGAWSVMPGVANEGVTWRATGGVDQNKVLSNVHLLLARADEADDTEPPLAELYAYAAVAIEEESFDEDAQTDTLTISCVRTEAFETYECLLSVTFSFSQTSGQWGVSQVEVSDGARERNLHALFGTWTGTFQSQQTDGGKCLAAREGGLTVEVLGASVGDSAAMLSGYVGGVAHYHANPAEDAPSCKGDVALGEVHFTARLESDDEGLVFVAELPEDVGGNAVLTLRFGTSEDPSAAVAEVRSEFTYDDAILFIPYERTATYVDSFMLRRTEQAVDPS